MYWLISLPVYHSCSIQYRSVSQYLIHWIIVSTDVDVFVLTVQLIVIGICFVLVDWKNSSIK
ncbi:conserved domain protein [Neorickettsia sennetsu str. Miyayama]|uniref:Conserved domain protein n=1 Tax=Ehrlichia sennetsu (strain ATCC VR-367 / Miyayama) TaxID=222891 RepID=Q2GEV8_EHRS3|nr:conserved domain protein [Neorickettsia sennetsu str. Miyayama]